MFETTHQFYVLEISLPTSLENVFDPIPLSCSIENQKMHIGGLNFNKNLQEIKNDAMNEGVLKEINKNTSSDQFKASKKHKFGHGKKEETNLLCGKLKYSN